MLTCTHSSTSGTGSHSHAGVWLLSQGQQLCPLVALTVLQNPCGSLVFLPVQNRAGMHISVGKQTSEAL